jgi:hypothetical protein
MRSAFLLPLRAVLSLGPSGAFASVTCDPKPGLSVNGTHALVPSTDALAEVTTHCIENVCATAGTDITSTEDCGLLVITITQLGNPHLDVGDCVSQLHSIFDQCITTEGVSGGTSQAHNVLYDISVADGNDHSHLERLDARSEEGDWWEKRMLDYENYELQKRANAETEAEDHQALEVRGRVKAKTAKSGKGTHKSTTKPKTGAVKKPKTAAKPKKDKTAKACPLPKKKTGKPAGKAGAKKPVAKPGVKPKKGKKAGGKVTRSIEDDHLSQAEHEELLPRGNGQSSAGGKKRPAAKTRPKKSSGKGKKPVKQPKNCAQSEFYEETDLSDDATWWTFNSRPGWKEGVAAGTPEHTILAKMRPNGKFDAVKVDAGYMEVVGKKSGGAEPGAFEKEVGEGYLLSNGGFFNLNNRDAVGDVVLMINDQPVKQDSEPIPSIYQNNYIKVTGDDGSFFHSGPPLPPSGDINFNHAKWKYWKDAGKTTQTSESKLVGSLAHASQANERLALVEMDDGDYYLFAYTAAHRADGLNIKGFRDLIVLFFGSGFTEHGSPTQSVNLDGGGSIHVSWNDGSGGEPVRIARGAIADEIPLHSGKKVANMVKITPGQVNE